MVGLCGARERDMPDDEWLLADFCLLRKLWSNHPEENMVRPQISAASLLLQSN